MLDKNLIQFEEKYDSEEYETTTIYFIYPKEMLEKEYPDATMATLSIECPTNCIEASTASCVISPTKKECGGLTDYDWQDIELPYEDIEMLLELALEKQEKS